MIANRNAIYAKIAIARKQLDMDEESYRAILLNEFNVQSAKSLNEFELNRLLQYFAKLGASFTQKRGRPRTNTKVTAQARPDFIEITDSMPCASQKRMILAIWRKLGYSMSSLETRVKREFNSHSFVWLKDAEHVKKLLCDLQKREGAYDRKRAKYTRICHDCGEPTDNYRCDKCNHKQGLAHKSASCNEDFMYN